VLDSTAAGFEDPGACLPACPHAKIADQAIISRRHRPTPHFMDRSTFLKFKNFDLEKETKRTSSRKKASFTATTHHFWGRACTVLLLIRSAMPRWEDRTPAGRPAGTLSCEPLPRLAQIDSSLRLPQIIRQQA